MKPAKRVLITDVTYHADGRVTVHKPHDVTRLVDALKRAARERL